MRRSLVASVALAGCGVFGPEPRVEVQVGAGQFEPQEFVPFMVRNNSSSPIDVPRCGERVTPEVEVFDAGRWRNFQAAICPANTMTTPLTLDPGASVRDSLSFFGAAQLRLRLRYARDGMSGEAVSRAFLVTTVPGPIP